MKKIISILLLAVLCSCEEDMYAPDKMDQVRDLIQHKKDTVLFRW